MACYLLLNSLIHLNSYFIIVWHRNPIYFSSDDYPFVTIYNTIFPLVIWNVEWCLVATYPVHMDPLRQKVIFIEFSNNRGCLGSNQPSSWNLTTISTDEYENSSMIDDNRFSVQSKMTRCIHTYSYSRIYSIKIFKSLVLSYFNSCFALGVGHLAHNNQVHPGQCPSPLLKLRALLSREKLYIPPPPVAKTSQSRHPIYHSASWRSTIFPPLSSEEEGKKIIQNVPGTFPLK